MRENKVLQFAEKSSDEQRKRDWFLLSSQFFRDSQKSSQENFFAN